MSHSTRLFAVIPAAGLSRRMGQPKLLLPLAGLTILERLMMALHHPEIAARHVVVRKGDPSLQQEVIRLGGRLVVPPVDPPEMRASVSAALADIQQQFAPSPDDGWLLVPADHPVLDAELIDALITVWNRERPQILVPRYGDRRGHPTLFRWTLAQELDRIPPDRGLNWLVREHADEVIELPTDSDATVTDLDTPEDYSWLRAKWEGM